MNQVQQTAACFSPVAAGDELTARAAPLIRHVYEVRPRSGSTGYELISDALPQGRLTFEKQRVATGYARLHSGSHPLLIRIFDAGGSLIATHDDSPAPAALPT